MLIESLLSSAERYPDRLAVHDQLGMELTYSRLVRMAGVMKGIIEKETKCPRVGIFLPSCVGFVMTWYGILWAGRASVPLNLLLHPEELKRVVKDAGIDTVITLRFPAAVAQLNNTVDQLPVEKKIYINELPLKRKFITSHFWPQPRVPRVAPEDVATLLYTSGTSGDPKGVMLTEDNLAMNARGCIEHLHPDSDQRFLGLLPLFHSFGLTTMMVTPITLGSTVYYLPRFVPAQVVRTIAEQRSTMMMAIASTTCAGTNRGR
jgi:long-chain acyl-CoA synthetase